MAEKLEFELGPNLNVFTGETGAGKSLVISAVAFAFGQSSGIVKMRDERENAQITVTVNSRKLPGAADLLDEFGIEPDGDEIIVSRTIAPDGKTKNYVNGSKVNLSVLQKIGQKVVEISGQNDELLLLDPKIQSELVDRYCGAEMAELKNALLEKYRELKALVAEKESLMASESERAREIDLYSYQVNEIKEAALADNEEAELAERIDFLKNAENIAKIREEILSTLDGGESPSVTDGISRVVSLLSRLAGFDRSFERLAEAANDAYYTMKDVSETVVDLSSRLDYSENELDEKIERQHLISSLKRKYGQTVPDILAYLATTSRKLDELQNFDQTFSTINIKIEKIFGEYLTIADSVSGLRIGKKEEIEGVINPELHALDMKNAIFQIAIHSPESRSIENAGPNGFETVEFMIRTNPGMPMTPIAKTASGGEMSRIMLAIKNVLSDYSEVPAIIFDEIDTGIGGFTLNSIGDKLRAIASKKQVICITHSPIIASFSNHHYLVKKEVVNNEKTLINIQRLTEQEIEGEIARMLGNDSDIGISHARELLSKNKSSS